MDVTANQLPWRDMAQEKNTHPVRALIPFPVPFLPKDTGNMEKHRKSHLAKLNPFGL